MYKKDIFFLNEVVDKYMGIVSVSLEIGCDFLMFLEFHIFMVKHKFFFA